MEYIKQNFVDGAVLNAEELNYIEDGIAKNANEISKFNSETWTFTLIDGSTITKQVVII